MPLTASVTLAASSLRPWPWQAALDIFGFGKGELHNKNVRILIPQPYADAHPGYMKNYVDTGGCGSVVGLQGGLRRG